MNIDWNEMPSWADVWFESFIDHSNSGWCKRKGNVWINANGHAWHKNHEEGGMYKIYYPPLPPEENKPEWNGKGLPPVGTVCEYQIGSRNKSKCEYIGRREKGSIVILDYDSGHFCCYHPEQITLHPIKSDKEKWIEKATNCCDPDYEQIYDALSGELPIPKGIKK